MTALKIYIWRHEQIKTSLKYHFLIVKARVLLSAPMKLIKLPSHAIQYNIKRHGLLKEKLVYLYSGFEEKQRF